MQPIFVSFFTTHNGYGAEALELGKTLDHFRLPADLVPVPPFVDWVTACGYKPAFLLIMRQKHAGRPLVWLDADARVRATPALLLEMPPDVDFAAHWKDGTELLSGTLYFGATANADKLLSDWSIGCRDNPRKWDQQVLQSIVESRQELKIEKLPASYTQIFDTMRTPDPVIEHMQASRRLRQ